MKCRVCDVLLSDFESTRKNAETGEFLDMCNYCFSYVKRSIETTERIDLLTEGDHAELDTVYEDLDGVFDYDT